MKTFTTDRGPSTYRYPIFTHSRWKYKPSQPIGDHPLWPCTLRVVSNFVHHSYMPFYVSLIAQVHTHSCPTSQSMAETIIFFFVCFPYIVSYMFFPGMFTVFFIFPKCFFHPYHPISSFSSISRCESLDGAETPGPSLRRGQLLSQGGLHRLGGPRPAALGRRADQETQARGETKWGNILGYSK